jgi:hypothetical protein
VSRRVSLGSLLVVLASLSSCTILHINNDKSIDAERARGIHDGTTYAEVLVALGPPGKVTALPSGFAFLYENTQVLQRGIAVSLYLVRVSVSKGNRLLDAYVVVFDERGVVVGHGAVTEWVPLSFKMSVTAPTGRSARELKAWAPQHRWGMSLLSPLPETLNADNDLDAGVHGLEQRGTPTEVGQRTLESP